MFGGVRMVMSVYTIVSSGFRVRIIHDHGLDLSLG